MASLPRDENLVPVLGLVDSSTGLVRPALADSVTGRLLVSGTGGGGGSGTVTSVSVVSANGFAGTVANATTTPAITLTTTVTGILSGNGTAISAASTTGTGSVVLATSPTLVTPVLGVASATSINKVTLTAPATGSTLTIADGKTLTQSNTLTYTGTDGSSVNFGTGGTVLYGNQSITLSGDVTGTGSTAITTTVAKIAGTTVSGTTGSTNVVFSNSPTLVTPALGVATATSLAIGGATIGSNGLAVTGHLLLEGVTSTGATGTGNLVFATSPTLTTPTLGVASATSINKVAITAPATSATLTIADGKTLTANNSITLAGTDSTTMTFPTTSASIARTDAGQTFTGVQSMTSPDITTSLTTPSTTFSLVNATATTVNFAGAATTINMGGSGAAIKLGGGATAAELRFLEPSGSGTNYSAFKAQAQAADITYTLPATVGAAGTVLTDAAGNGTLSWAAGGSFSYGSSVSGTTADGLTITLNATTDDGASALKLVANNTQSNQPALANLQIGTSGNVLGLMIQGTGGTTGGAVGTGLVHMTLWGNTATNLNKVLTVASETSYTETLAITANGTIAITAQASPAASTKFLTITANNTNANNTALVDLELGTSAKAMGLLIKGTGSATGGDVGTGTNHLTLWGNTAASASKAIAFGNGTSYTEGGFIRVDGRFNFAPPDFAGSTSEFILTSNHADNATNNASILNVSTVATIIGSVDGMIYSHKDSGTVATTSFGGTVVNSGTLVACVTADTSVVRATLSRTHSTASTITDTSAQAGLFRRTNVTSNASANYTISSPTFSIEQVATQTSGTLAVTGAVLLVKAGSGVTGAPLAFTQNNITSTHFRKIWTETNAAITIWMSDGTDPNGALSGTAGDVCYNGATNKPAYCTGTTNWTNLV